GGPPASLATGVSGLRGNAMRLLHAGHDHGRGCPARENARAVATRDPPRPQWQSVPLRDVSADYPSGRASRRGGERRRAMKSDVFLAPEVEPEIELERYELREAPRYQFDLDRRDFFRLVGSGIVVCLLVDGEADAQQRGFGGRGGSSGPREIGGWG